MLITFLQNNQQITPVTTGGGGTYPGYAAEKQSITARKQAEQALETVRTTQDVPIASVVTAKPKVPFRLDELSSGHRAMKRSLDAAMKAAAQQQALFELRAELIEAAATRLQLDDDEALVALLLTI